MTILVAGNGRCGLTLMMQMLDASGFPVRGSFPGYEDDPIGSPLNYSGVAIKVVDPLLWKMPDVPWRCIHLTRNPGQQARSAIKFLRAMTGMRIPANYHAFAEGIVRNVAQFRALLKSKGVESLEVAFEQLLADPVAEFIRVAEWLQCDLDVAAAVRQVRNRKPECLDGLLEIQLVDAGGLL